jgi:hypothetical protein
MSAAPSQDGLRRSRVEQPIGAPYADAVDQYDRCRTTAPTVAPDAVETVL